MPAPMSAAVTAMAEDMQLGRDPRGNQRIVEIDAGADGDCLIVSGAVDESGWGLRSHVQGWGYISARPACRFPAGTVLISEQ